MKDKSILIVEDEVLIAKQMKNWLLKTGISKVENVIDYNSAILKLKNNHFDLVLLDIQLSGEKTGLDVSNWATKNKQTPFIFLSSYSDQGTLEKISKAKPLGYINKPIREVNFLMMINLHLSVQKDTFVKFETKTKTLQVNIDKLQYIQAEHVYLSLYFENNKIETIRCSLSNFLALVPNNKLLKVNRSIAVNPSFITKKTSKSISIESKEFSISSTQKNLFS